MSLITVDTTHRSSRDVSPDPPPLSVSADNRYLLQDGEPWLINVAAGSWFAIQAISNTDSNSYIDTLAAAGFNAMSVSLIANDTGRYPSNSGNHYAAPNWNNGTSDVPPFTTAGNFSTFNSTYGTHALERIQYLLSKGFVPLLTLCYPGYSGDNGSSAEGWTDEMLADTDAHMTTYGAAAETLISGIAKALWVAGGDVSFTGGTASATLLTRTMAAVSGVQSVNANRLWMAHLNVFGQNTGLFPYEVSSIGSITGMLWSQYEYSDVDVRAYRRIASAYAHSPTRPVPILDPGYEEDPGVSLDRTRLRYRTHSTMCAGACGMAYARGSSGVGTAWYQMTTTSWATSLPGLADHTIAYNFWRALPWWLMEPDTAGTFVTAGRGTNADTSDNYITVRASTACLVAYFPPSAGNTITVDFSQFTGAGFFSPSGQRRARWWDPTNNTYTPINTFSTSGTQNFTQPSSNNSTGSVNDWLLVID